MKSINEKLALLQAKMKTDTPVTIMIIGLGSVGVYLLDYLISLSDKRLHIVVAGRNAEKMQKDVNIVRTAAAIRGQLRSKIDVEADCNLEDVSSIALCLDKWHPDFIINSSRVYSGLKYGSLSWNNLRAYGIWTPLSIRYARNIMKAYEAADCNAISINTSYSDAVIPWLKSAGNAYFDFGSGNLNHLIPRMKFYIADKYGIENLNEIDITLCVSHFHDVVISKEGHSEGVDILLDVRYRGDSLPIDKDALLKACMIPMPVDQKRNMMNASSNFNIIYSILDAISNKKKVKIHTPGVNGEIGGYPYIIDATGSVATSYFDTSIFSMEKRRMINRESIYLDGVADIKEGNLYYTPELVEKVKNVWGKDLPLEVHFNDIDEVGQYIIDNIIKPATNC